MTLLWILLSFAAGTIFGIGWRTQIGRALGTLQIEAAALSIRLYNWWHNIDPEQRP
jgi:hypothetical protein